ncbi:hypothetical protein BKA63DRAFT_582674 [Paraphoma chrysanthemicola]|nr:hypothetical protein BKA63DRAFT_582674 [Paraphoma chrysanthemicola]
MDRPKAIQVVNDCQRAGKVLRSGQAAPKGRIVVKRTWAKAERSGGTSQKSTRRRDRGQDRTDDEVTMWYPGVGGSVETAWLPCTGAAQSTLLAAPRCCATVSAGRCRPSAQPSQGATAERAATTHSGQVDEGADAPERSKAQERRVCMDGVIPVRKHSPVAIARPTPRTVSYFVQCGRHGVFEETAHERSLLFKKSKCTGHAWRLRQVPVDGTKNNGHCRRRRFETPPVGHRRHDGVETQQPR